MKTTDGHMKTAIQVPAACEVSSHADAHMLQVSGSLFGGCCFRLCSLLRLFFIFKQI